MWVKGIGLTLAASLCAFTLASCGSDTGSGGGSDAATGASTATTASTSSGGGDARSAAAATAGKAAGKAAGDPVELKPVTVAVLLLNGASTSVQKATQGIKAAAGTLGWKVISCDAQGDATKMVSCYSSLLAQHPAAIFSNNIEPAVIATQLKTAQQQGVIRVNYGGATNPSEDTAPPTMDGSYFFDDRAMASGMIQSLQKLLPQGGSLAEFIAPELFSIKSRQIGLESAISGTNFKFVDKYHLDLTDLVDGAKRATSSILSKTPDLTAFLVPISAASTGILTAMQERGGAKRPPIYVWNSDPSTLEQLRSGAIAGIYDGFIDTYSWVAVDQVAEQIGRKVPVAKQARPKYDLPDIYKQVMFTKDNAPSGDETTPPADFATFFKTKWSTEFTNVK